MNQMAPQAGEALLQGCSEATLNQRPWSVFARRPSNDDYAAKRLTHVSLFSGCGGMDLGFDAAGFETIFANDVDEDACETYRKNIGDIFTHDIRELEIPNFAERPSVLTAGFPCQPFSNAGSRRGIDDERGTLYRAAINFIKHLQPQSVVFENVRGLLSFKSEKGESLIQEICQELDSLGYNVVLSLLNASHHHVPQKRLRVFIVGVRKEHNKIFSFPAPIFRNDLNLRNVILDIEVGTPNQKEVLDLSPQSEKLNIMIPEGGSWKDVPYRSLPERMKKIRDNMERYHSPNFYRCFHRDEIAGTITAAFTPENAGILHPTICRPYSVRESARIQSFPDWFEFLGKNVKSKYQQIGNAVPPRLAYEVAVNLRKVLEGDLSLEKNDGITFKEFISTGKPLKVCDKDIIFSNCG